MKIKSPILKEKIIKILRDYEDGLMNDSNLETSTSNFDPITDHYEDYLDYIEEQERNKKLKYVTDVRDEENGHYEIISYTPLPNKEYVKVKLGEGNIQHFFAELERMLSDGLILIGTQKAQQFVLGRRGDFSCFTRGDGWIIDTDSIVLTTKGKSWIGYFKYQILEQKIALILALVSLAVSLLK